ncbi:MAG TPA: phage holin family protein [Candidatus Sulfotelmatobacter sp.]|nr:phage holin family protein [Candidatus Sulfotelmatobacter sp.]
MFRFVIHWLLAAATVMFAVKVVPGFFENGLQPGFIAALVVGFANATLGSLMKLMTSPLGIAVFIIFMVVMDSILLLASSRIIDGFYVYSWQPAAWTAGGLTVLGLLIRAFSQE